MKRTIATLLALVFSVLLMSVSLVNAQTERLPYLILLRGNSVPADIQTNIANAGGEIMHIIPQVGIVTAWSSNPDFASLLSGVRSIQEIGGLPAFAIPESSVSENFNADSIALDPASVTDALYLSNNWGIRRVRAPEAWAAGYTGSHNTVVAVIDTGIAWNHPDLAPNVVFAACYTSAGSVVGFDTTQPQCNPYPSLSDHGTHVSGTVAAVVGGGVAGFGGGVVGVGPDLGLAGYNTFENIPGCGACTYASSRWLAEIDAADRGFEVINMSLGSFFSRNQGSGPDNAGLNAYLSADNRVTNYVRGAGTTLVAAAGNDGADLNGLLYNSPGGLPGIINVGSSGIRTAPVFPQANYYDVRAYYSNYGSALTVAGPGGDCGLPNSCDPATRPANFLAYTTLSTIAFLDPVCAATASCTPWYGYKIGTSMASPHVAGVAGLVADANPSIRPNQMSALLRSSAENVGSRQQFGHGIVDAAAALGVD